jgi:hypothetical protein
MENTNFKKRQVTKENAKGNIKSWPLVVQGTINKYFELICNFTNRGTPKLPVKNTNQFFFGIGPVSSGKMPHPIQKHLRVLATGCFLFR